MKLIWPLLKGWLFSFLIFGVLAFAMVSQSNLQDFSSWEEALRRAQRDWLPWAVVAPLIFLLVSWLPLERDRWKLALPAHLLSGFAAIGLAFWWAEYVYPWRPPSRSPQSRVESPARRPPGSPPGDPVGAPPRPPTTGNRPPSPSRSGSPQRWRPWEWTPAQRFFASLWFRVPIYLALVSLAHALHFYSRSQERERSSLELRASLERARLEALKMQLQPHFLFNALNSIAALVHKDPDAADEMLAALSDFLRLVLETSGEQELPLRRELQLVERYLAIEHARFGDRLQYQVSIAAETEPALVPAFLLQPLVENAVRHGLEPRTGAGLLTISARREQGLVHIVVTDNGVGLAGEAPMREGIGLSNTRARLRELYNGVATLEMRGGVGVTVEITLPFRLAA